MTQIPKVIPPDLQLGRDPLARIAVSAAPVVLEGRYRLLMRALWELRHSRKTRWGVGLGSGRGIGRGSEVATLSGTSD